MSGVGDRLLGELLEFSHDAKDGRALSAFTLERLQSLTPWDGAICACLPYRSDADAAIIRHPDPARLTASFRHYVENQPRMRRELQRVRAAERMSRGAILDSDIFSSGERERLVFYDEIGRPLRIVNLLAARVMFRGRPLARLILMRSGRSRPFGARDVERILPLLPAIGVAHAALQSCARAPSSSKVALSPRERQIAELVAAGYRNPDIAAVLGTSRNTVRNQLAALFERLSVTNRAELVALLARSGGGAARSR